MNHGGGRTNLTGFFFTPEICLVNFLSHTLLTEKYNFSTPKYKKVQSLEAYLGGLCASCIPTPRTHFLNIDSQLPILCVGATLIYYPSFISFIYLHANIWYPWVLWTSMEVRVFKNDFYNTFLHTLHMSMQHRPKVFVGVFYENIAYLQI